MEENQIKQIVYEIFRPENMTFNKLLGFEIDLNDLDDPKIIMKMNNDLIGNHYYKILHGGAISSILDTVGGLVAMIGVLKKLEVLNYEILAEKLSKISTVDLRVDYLRPGKGDYFIATAHVIRAGNKVCVNRMELRNDEGALIAVGTGTYLVG